MSGALKFVSGNAARFAAASCRGACDRSGIAGVAGGCGRS